MITIPVILHRVTYGTDWGDRTYWRTSFLKGARDFKSEAEIRAACESDLAAALAKVGEKTGLRLRFKVERTRIPFPEGW